jgi:hypothetical protein
MMQIRWWNSFIVLAAILIAIGFIGAITGARMVFDPGRTSSGKEWVIYLVAGILMLINGLLPATGGNGAREDENKRNPKA